MEYGVDVLGIEVYRNGRLVDFFYDPRHTIRIKLTAHGHDLLQQRHYPLMEEDSAGWSEWTLGDLMRVFRSEVRDWESLPVHPFEETVMS